MQVWLCKSASRKCLVICSWKRAGAGSHLGCHTDTRKIRQLERKYLEIGFPASWAVKTISHCSEHTMVLCTAQHLGEDKPARASSADRVLLARIKSNSNNIVLYIILTFVPLARMLNASVPGRCFRGALREDPGLTQDWPRTGWRDQIEIYRIDSKSGTNMHWPERKNACAEFGIAEWL